MASEILTPLAVVDAIWDIQRGLSVEACTSAFERPLATLGIDIYACGEIDLDDRNRAVFHAIKWPEDWRRYYFSSDLLHRDPVVGELERRTGPFTWAELRSERVLSQVGTKALDYVVEAGWADGLVVPIARGGRRRGLISLVARDAVFSLSDIKLLTPLCICFHERMRSLVVAHGLPVLPAGLTSRELDCLVLVTRGKSDKEIAAALAIAPSTAHGYVENARRRLMAATRAEMAAIAVSLGIVHR